MDNIEYQNIKNNDNNYLDYINDLLFQSGLDNTNVSFDENDKIYI